MNKESYIYATYHEKAAKRTSLDGRPGYGEYRRKWEQNPVKHITGKFPVHLDIESTTACNLKCPMCFQSFNPPKPGYMKMPLYEKLIAEGAAKGLCSVKLNFRGEPLMHPRIAGMVEYAKENGIIEVMLNTNGTLLDGNMAHALMRAGLDKIIFSADAFTREHYESIRRGARFNEVLGNIRRLQAMKERAGTDLPAVRVQAVIMRGMKGKGKFIRDYVRFWKPLADCVAVEDEIEWDYSKVEGNIVCRRFRCPQPWQRLFIGWDGKITLCCGDLYDEMVLGDANHTDISRVWNSKRLGDIRSLIRKGQTHKIPICRKCGNRRKVIEDIEDSRDNLVTSGPEFKEFQQTSRQLPDKTYCCCSHDERYTFHTIGKSLGFVQCRDVGVF